MMRKSHEKIIDEQVKKWEIMRAQKAGKEEGLPVITVSREPGSGGRVVAERIAKQLGLDLFHGQIIQEIAESADTSARILETLDEKGLSVLDDWISTIGTIGEHGRAVIVGRGASFILPREVRFRVRIVAPLEIRVKNVAHKFDVPSEEARRRVLRADSDRRAFVRKYFHADITDPVNYDLVINTETLSIDAAVEAIKGGLGR
jgi:cytidylate kinase